MGYYIQADGRLKGKGEWLVEHANAIIASPKEARAAMANHTHDVVCVVDNGEFEAAAFAFNSDELEDFLDPSDPRKKRCYLLPLMVGAKLSGYHK